MDYLGVPDLNNIVNKYLMEESNCNSNINCNCNITANKLGADLFITEPNLYWLCYGNHKLLVEKYNNSTNLNSAIYGACYGGHLNLVMQLAKHTNDLGKGLIEACRGGHLSIVKYLVEHAIISEKYFNEALIESCDGHLEIVQFLIEYKSYAKIYLNIGLEKACLGGHLLLVKYLISCGANNINECFLITCQGHLGIFDYLQVAANSSALFLSGKLLDEREHKQLEIVKYLVEFGKANHIALSYNDGLYNSTHYGKLKIVNYLNNVRWIT